MVEASEKILIVGSGGREHAIGWKIKKDNPNTDLYFAPGNAGTQTIGTNLDLGVMDINAQVNFAKDNGVGFVIYGPEAPLIKGAVDEMQQAGIEAFGPSEKAARLEGSKIWAVEIMEKYGIPHP